MPSSNKIHYGWIVVGVTCLALLTGAGVRSTPGILMVPLEQEFHWSRATIALAVSINLILYGCIGPFAAAIMERFGVRRSVLCALTLVAVGVASTSLMREAWQLILLWGFLVGGGTGFLATVLAATVATRWFTARRGLVIGMLSGGAATGQLLFLPVMANITAAYGWRVDRADGRSRRALRHADRRAADARPAVRRGADALWRDRRAQARGAAEGQSGRRSPSARWARRCGFATSGCWPARSSSAAPRPTD